MVDLSRDEQLRRFEALIHASPDFIAIASMDQRVEFVNAAGRKLIGMPDDVDVAQTRIGDYLTPEAARLSEDVEQPAVMRDGHDIETIREMAKNRVPCAFVHDGSTSQRQGAPMT